MRVLRYRKSERGRYAKRHRQNVERVSMPIAKGDTVRVMRGEEKGREGKVLRVYPKTGRITIEGVNIVKRHRKARRAEEKSEIMEMPAPMHHSNVMLLDPKADKPTRIRYRTDDEGDAKARRRSKERIAVKTGDAIPRSR